MATSNKILVIYLLGSGHCGSTLLDLIMDSHSQIVGVGELSNWFFEKEKQSKILCTCRRPLSKCSFWQEVSKGIPVDFQFSDSKLEIYRKKIDFLFNRKKYVFASAKTKKVNLERYLKLNEKIYENILTVSRKKAIFDSSKDVERASILLASDKLEVILLHLVRDGRGVSYSYKKKYGGIISPMLRWTLKNLKIEILKRRYPRKFIFLRYEDFCKNPEQAIEKVLKRIGFTFEPKMLEFRRKIHHQVGGNRLRFLIEEQQIKEDTAWKTKLPLLDKIIFNLLFGWLNLFYQKIK